MRAPSPDAEAVIERRGRAGVIVLNRPEALNALTLTMVRLIAAALDEWEGDGAVDRIVLLGAGERAFCAGGDIRRLYDLGRASDHDAQLTFWREEYQLDRRIKTYPKPIVALVDGIAMGGGVGLAMHAAHTVAGERFIFAMPEVGIGFFPDVGAAWFLPRLPFRAGVYFALTGLRADAGDAVALGLAQTFVPSAAFLALAQALESDEPVKTTLTRFAAPPPRSSLTGEGEAIEACFSGPDRTAILEALREAETQGRAFAAPAQAAMLEKSPTSQAIALKQMALGATIDFDEALRMDYRIVSRICVGHDFYEGVRALIVDKDNRPRWNPPPSRVEIDAYFAHLGDRELEFPAPYA
ncbi:MAG TPA: enoyl-CoA hydratase/isomerase family protein [Roseiarcus sp.]|nr:enoyl-CoA hydratase/isomerase family protein [Roseiarcus sp.]